MNFAEWWKNMCIGSFFLFLMFFVGGVIHFPTYYGNVVHQFIEAVQTGKF